MTEFWENEKQEDYILKLKDPEKFYKATIKRSGCIDLKRYYNVPFDICGTDKEECIYDFIHICDIDEFIQRLTELKEKTINHFKVWPG